MVLNQSKIILGTVQFGLNYGVANKTGKLGEDEIPAILLKASEAGINTIDTAYSYGNSEELLGKYIAQLDCSFNVISGYAIVCGYILAFYTLQSYNFAVVIWCNISWAVVVISKCTELIDIRRCARVWQPTKVKCFCINCFWYVPVFIILI